MIVSQMYVTIEPIHAHDDNDNDDDDDDDEDGSNGM
jgi:hypothetical protein